MWSVVKLVFSCLKPQCHCNVSPINTYNQEAHLHAISYTEPLTLAVKQTFTNTSLYPCINVKPEWGKMQGI